MKEEPKKKPRGKAKRWTQQQLEDAAKPDLQGAAALAKKVKRLAPQMWDAEKEGEQ